jgi:hypothetical protein
VVTLGSIPVLAGEARELYDRAVQLADTTPNDFGATGAGLPLGRRRPLIRATAPSW